jgi:sugar/nucleoside kinase (ribokinase family)
MESGVGRTRSPMANYDVLLFDPYFCDLIVTGLPELPRLGKDLFGTDMGIEAGGTFNTVRALHRLQIRVGWACDLGNDLFSQYVLAEISKEGVDRSLLRMHDKPVRGFSLAFSYRNDRGFISYMDRLEPVDRVPYIDEHRPSVVLLNMLESDESGRSFVQAARDMGTTVFLDSQSTSKTLVTPGVPEMLRSIHVLLINESEALGITGAPSRDEAGTTLAQFTPLVVLKCGAEGAFAYKGYQCISAPALDVNVIDTTGAGDCFNAGFIAAYLRDQSLEICLRMGNVCGGLSTTAHGTVATPTLEQTRQYVQMT